MSLPLRRRHGMAVPPGREKLLYAPRGLAYTVPAFLKMNRLIPSLMGILLVAGSLHAQTSPFSSSEDFDRFARKLRESALSSIEPKVIVPTTSAVRGIPGNYPWKLNIVTTVFWVGESATTNNPVHNRSSSWDMNWGVNFGGFDNPDPAARKDFLPANFTPKENPFYVALPYNDVSGGRHKPEARRVIPWFAHTFRAEGQSVCRNRWVAIRKGNRVCYAQWSDCGPFRTDHWEYVFGNEAPKPNLNQGAGLDVSPAVRDFIGMNSGKDVVDWKFVEERDVPRGPWARLGTNNNVAKRYQQGGSAVASAAPAGKPAKSRAAEEMPTVINR